MYPSPMQIVAHISAFVSLATGIVQKVSDSYGID